MGSVARVHEVDAEGLFEVLDIGAGGKRAGIGNNAVKAHAGLRGVMNEGRKFLSVRHIERAALGMNALGPQLLQRLGNTASIARADRDSSALIGKRESNGAANSPRAAGYEKMLACEFEVHGPAPSNTKPAVSGGFVITG